jgi:hypothetical protein
MKRTTLPEANPRLKPHVEKLIAILQIFPVVGLNRTVLQLLLIC